MGWRWVGGLCLAATLFAVGCDGEAETLVVPEWTLCPSATGCAEGHAVFAPTTFDERVRRDEVYLLRSRVVLPEHMRAQRLTLAVPYFLAAADLAVDGEVLERSDGRRHERYRSSGALTWNIPERHTRGETLTMELRVSHNWQQSAWLLTVPRLVLATNGDTWTAFSRNFNDWSGSIGLGALLTISFCSLVLFWFERTLRVYASLAVQTAATASYPVFVLGWGQHFAGRYDLLVMSLLLLLASTAAIFTTHFGTGLRRPSWWWCAPALICSPLLIAFYDGFSLSYLEGPLIVAFVGGTTTYQLVVLGRLYRQRPGDRTVQMHILSWAVFLPFFPTEAALWLELGDFAHGLRLGSLGVIGYSLVHFVGISRMLILHRQTSDRLAADLASKVASIEHLNAELRRQIAERSRELSAALSRVRGAQPSRVPTSGDVVDDRYRIENEIGSGAMGTVFRVTRLSDGAVLAMKVLINVGHPHNMARFARESQLISELNHPNVVSVFDISVAEDGLFYMVMEYVPGVSLKKCSDRFGDVGWGLSVLRGLASGLRAIHARGVIHRDIKPDNVVVRSADDGTAEVKITDFGISTAMDQLTHGAGKALSGRVRRVTEKVAGPMPRSGEIAPATPAGGAAANPTAPVDTAPADTATDAGPTAGPSLVAGAAEETQETQASTGKTPIGFDPRRLGLQDLTETGAFLGTPYYMAPELLSGTAEANASADIYALGLVAYEVLAGERPFPRPTVLEALQKRKQPDAATLMAKAPGLSPAVVDLVVGALAEDPERRPSAEDFVRVLTTGVGDVVEPPRAAEPAPG